METRILKIDEDTKLDRLDKVLAEKLNFSRKRIKDLLDEGNVLVNQKVMKASYKVCVNDEIEVRFGNKLLTVKVLEMLDSTKKEDASKMYEIIRETRIEENA